MNRKPFDSIRPSWFFYLAFIIFVLVMVPVIHDLTLGSIIFMGLLIVSAMWERGHEKQRWQETAEVAGLDLQGGQLSGTYAGRRVLVPVEISEGIEDSSSAFMRVIRVELNRPKDAEFVLTQRRVRQPENGHRLAGVFIIDQSNPPDFADHVFASDYLLRLLYDIRPLHLTSLVLKASTLTFSFIDIPNSRLQEALTIASDIAEAVERTPEAATRQLSGAADHLTV
jgi:hypothetical protein